jgi:hypothetical protein
LNRELVNQPKIAMSRQAQVSKLPVAPISKSGRITFGTGASHSNKSAVPSPAWYPNQDADKPVIMRLATAAAGGAEDQAALENPAFS